MDLEKKLPKSSVLPAKKSKVFHKEPENASESPIWVPPSFVARDHQPSPEHGRFFKFKKPSFTPKPSQSLAASFEETAPVESSSPIEDFQPASAAQDHVAPKISSVLVASIFAAVLICFVLVGWLAYHQGFMASQNRLTELRMEPPLPIPPEFQATIESEDICRCVVGKKQEEKEGEGN